MKFKRTVLLATFVVTMGLLLGASAQDVIFGDPSNPAKATAIQDLNVDGTRYDVEFLYAIDAPAIYGPLPGVYEFNTESSAMAAVEAVNDALNAENALFVGSETSPVTIEPLSEIYFVGFERGIDIPGIGPLPPVPTVNAWVGSIPDLTWIASFDSVVYVDARTWAEFTPVDGTPPTAEIVASSLPNSRSVQVGDFASAFGLIINTSDNMAMDCGIEPLTEVPAEFVYQTTDASNIPVGMPNTRVDIEPEGSQNFVFAFTPTAPISPTDVQLSYDCSNSEQAPVTSGVNTLLLSASNDPVPDIVALAATPSNDGILNLPGANGSSAFSVAATNFGSADMITASAVSSMALPISLLICETNPATAECISGPASRVTSMVDTGAMPTYSIFVTANGTVPFIPETNRIFVEFRDAGDVVRGLTSVAVRTQ